MYSRRGRTQKQQEVSNIHQPVARKAGRVIFAFFSKKYATTQIIMTTLFALQETAGLEMSGYLITPVQRIPRYELLMCAARKCTPPDHPEFPSIVEVSSAAHLSSVCPCPLMFAGMNIHSVFHRPAPSSPLSQPTSTKTSATLRTWISFSVSRSRSRIWTEFSCRPRENLFVRLF